MICCELCQVEERDQEHPRRWRLEVLRRPPAQERLAPQTSLHTARRHFLGN